MVFRAANNTTDCAHPCPWGTPTFCQAFSERSATAAEEFITEFRAAGLRICETPELHGEIMDDIRLIRLHRFPWGLVYRIEKEQIHVLAVMHLHREPGYWLDRI